MSKRRTVQLMSAGLAIGVPAFFALGVPAGAEPGRNDGGPAPQAAAPAEQAVHQRSEPPPAAKHQQPAAETKAPAQKQEQVAAAKAPAQKQEQVAAAKAPAQKQEQVAAAKAPAEKQEQVAAAKAPAEKVQDRGANQSGPYDPSGVGQPSGNGKGDGKAVGKPDAGTVGNADAKNPPGQLPGPEDRNRGFECDENEGIGQGNPAHSFCQSAPVHERPDEPRVHERPDEPRVHERPDEPRVHERPDEPRVKVQALSLPVVRAQQAPVHPARVAPQLSAAPLPRTGSDTTTFLLLLGLALVAAGSGLQASTRRRRSSLGRASP